MRKLLYRLFGPLRSWLYWRVMIRMRGTRVEGAGVSPRARIARHAMVRRGTEVGTDVELGAYSHISGPRSYVEAARIGKFCSIARQVVIGPGDHDLSAVTTHPFPFSPAYGGLARIARNQVQKPAPVIGNDVWIGVNAVVLRGVTIADGAVVAANSVVTRDVAPYTVVGGAPARFIKSRFPPETVAALLRIRWWDWSEDELRNKAELFFDVDTFIRDIR